MDQELRKLLKRNLEISKENNEMLHRLQSSMRWSRFFKLAYWVVIIAIMLGAYYFIQPFVDQLVGAYGGLSDGIDNLQGIKDAIPGI